MARKGNKKVSLAKLMTLERDGPTPERLAKLPGVTIHTKASGRKVAEFAEGERKPSVGAAGEMRLHDQLDRLAARGQLDPDRDRNRQLHTAGDLFRQHWYRGSLADAVGSVDLNRTGGGNGHPAWLTPSSESVAYHRGKFRKMRESLDHGHFQVVFAVCCGDATLAEAGRDCGFGNDDGARAVALDRLRRGLEFVALLWGVMPPRPGNDNALDSVAKARMVVRGDEVDEIIGRMIIANAAEELARSA